MRFPAYPLTAEASLLLQVARLRREPAAGEQIGALVRSGLDWQLLQHLASRHRLESRLYAALDSHAAAGVPRPVFFEMWRRHELNARRNARLATEMLRVVRRIEHAGVPVLPYKGPVLAEQLYGDVALREFEDLDLLVPVSEAGKVVALLQADQYESADRLPPNAEEALYRSRTQYHRAFVNRDTGDKLELHWKTDPEFPIERASDPRWWAARGRATLRGEEVAAFSPSELLLLLCLHATKHQGHRLGWFTEIAELAAWFTIDWVWVDATAQALRCRRRLLASLVMTRDLLGMTLPGHLADASARDRVVRVITARMADRLFTDDVNELQEWPRLKASLALYDTPGQRLRHLLNVTVAPTPREYADHHLPRSAEFLHTPLRLVRLAMKYGLRR